MVVARAAYASVLSWSYYDDDDEYWKRENMNLVEYEQRA